MFIAPFVKIRFENDEEEQTYGSLLTEELLHIETGDPIKFEDMSVGINVAALWTKTNHYAAVLIEIYTAGTDIVRVYMFYSYTWRTIQKI